MKQSIAMVMMGLVCIGAYADASGGYQKKKEPMLDIPIVLSETFDNQGINLGMRADLLYMVYNVPALSYVANVNQESQTLSGRVLPVSGQLSFGCDVALLYTMPHQPGYSFEAGWFHIVSQFSDHKSGSNLMPTNVLSLDAPATGRANVHGHYNLNFFDLLIKKDYSIGEWMGIVPAVGLVGGYMDGVTRSHFVATSGGFSGLPAVTDATLSSGLRYEGIGLKLGASCSFKIGLGFRLDAQMYYNVLYGLERLSMDYTQDQLYQSLYNQAKTTYSQHAGRSFLDALLGLGWSTPLGDDTMFLDLHAGWRFQTFAEGWQAVTAVFDQKVQELSFAGQGLQTGVTFKF